MADYGCAHRSIRAIFASSIVKRYRYFCPCRSSIVSFAGIIAWIGLNQVGLTYERRERFAGKTKYPFKKMLYFAIYGSVVFRLRPFALHFSWGLFAIGLTVPIGIYAVVSWIRKLHRCRLDKLAFVVLILFEYPATVHEHCWRIRRAYVHADETASHVCNKGYPLEPADATIKIKGIHRAVIDAHFV